MLTLHIALAKTLPKVGSADFPNAHKGSAKRQPRRMPAGGKLLPIFLAGNMFCFLFFGQYGKED